MKLQTLFATCASAAMIFTIPAMAAAHDCVAGAPASVSQNYKGEANSLFQDLQLHAQRAFYHADQLQSFEENSNLGWDSQSSELTAIKRNVNHIEDELCQLQSMRHALPPAQQTEIDQLGATARLMVDNTQDAIVFGNDHQLNLWLGTYRKYTDNLYNEAKTLSEFIDHSGVAVHA